MLSDALSNGLTYPLGDAWAAIFRDLLALLETGQVLPVGEYPLAGGLENGGAKASVNIYTSKTPDGARYENHCVMADIQLVLEGEEYIDVVPTEALTSATAYDAAADVTFYHEKPHPAARIHLVPGRFAVLMPQDAHMPALAVQGQAVVKKLVVKLPAALIRQTD